MLQKESEDVTSVVISETFDWFTERSVALMVIGVKTRSERQADDPQTATDPVLSYESVSKVFYKDGQRVVALSDFNLTVRDREFVTLVGPSG